MRRRSKTGGEPVKTRRRKTVTPKRRDAPKAVRRSSASGQEAEVARLTRERNEAVEQQTATSEVLQVISSSPGDLQLVFETMLGEAVRICDAKFGNIFSRDGEGMHLVARHNTPAAFAEYRRRSPRTGLIPETFLALLWQIYSRRRSLQIHFLQCGHRCGCSRAMSSRIAWRTAGKLG